MIVPRPAAARGHVQHGWLDTYHTFSFASYHDPKYMGFRTLRVINEDWIAPGHGFGTHPHDNMEIITCVLEGALKHEDSMGHGSIIRPGDWQHMSAGTGITHSEFNASDSEPLHLYQIWIRPRSTGLVPGYAQLHISEEEKRDRLWLVASPDGRQGSLKIQTDTDLLTSRLNPGTDLDHALPPDRGAWVQVMRGSLTVNGVTLETSDGAAVSEIERLTFTAVDPAEFMLFVL